MLCSFKLRWSFAFLALHALGLGWCARPTLAGAPLSLLAYSNRAASCRSPFHPLNASSTQCAHGNYASQSHGSRYSLSSPDSRTELSHNRGSALLSARGSIAITKLDRRTPRLQTLVLCSFRSGRCSPKFLAIAQSQLPPPIYEPSSPSLLSCCKASAFRMGSSEPTQA